jgi:hypothetical protein
MNRLEFLKILGLGALASKVPWKFQKGTLDERLGRERTMADVTRDFIEENEFKFDHVFSETYDCVYVDFPHGRFVADVDGHWCEVSSDGKHWWRVPDGMPVEARQDAVEITSMDGTYASFVQAPLTVTVGTPTEMGWPNEEWSVP